MISDGAPEGFFFITCNQTGQLGRNTHGRGGPRALALTGDEVYLGYKEECGSIQGTPHRRHLLESMVIHGL